MKMIFWFWLRDIPYLTNIDGVGEINKMHGICNVGGVRWLGKMAQICGHYGGQVDGAKTAYKRSRP